MSKVIYEWNKNGLGLELGYNRYINIDGLKDEKIKEIIVKNSIAHDEEEIQEQLKEYLNKNYSGLVFDLPTELDGKIYSNGWEMLKETDYTYYKLSEILDEFNSGELTIKLNGNSKDFYRFVLDNFDVINELK